MTDSGKEVITLKGHTASVNSVSFFSDGKYLVSGSADLSIRIWNLLTAKEIKCLMGHSRAVKSVVLAPDGRYLASAGDDKTIRIWKIC